MHLRQAESFDGKSFTMLLDSPAGAHESSQHGLVDVRQVKDCQPILRQLNLLY